MVSYKIKVTFKILFNKNLEVNLKVLCKLQFFLVIVAPTTHKHTIMQNITFEVLNLKPKIHY